MIRRWLILGALVYIAGLLVGGACRAIAGSDGDTDAPRVQRRVKLAQALPGTTVASPVTITAIPVMDADDGVNLFSAMPVPVPEAAETTAAAPVSPYTYAGRLQEGGRWVVFLTDGQQQYVLHEGDHFAEGWKVAVLDQQKVVLQHAAERFEIRLDEGG